MNEPPGRRGSLSGERLRRAQSALLRCALEQAKTEGALEKEVEATTELAGLREAAKALPWGVVWNEYCRRADVPADSAVMNDIRAYEKAVLSRR